LQRTVRLSATQKVIWFQKLVRKNVKNNTLRLGMSVQRGVALEDCLTL